MPSTPIFYHLPPIPSPTFLRNYAHQSMASIDLLAQSPPSVSSPFILHFCHLKKKKICPFHLSLSLLIICSWKLQIAFTAVDYKFTLHGLSVDSDEYRQKLSEVGCLVAFLFFLTMKYESLNFLRNVSFFQKKLDRFCNCLLLVWEPLWRSFSCISFEYDDEI